MPERSVRDGVIAGKLAKAGMAASPTIIEGWHGMYRTFFLQDIPTLPTTAWRRSARSSRSPGNRPPRRNQRPHGGCSRRRPSPATCARLVGPRCSIAIIATGGRMEAGRFNVSPDPALLAMAEKVRLRFENGRSTCYARVELTTGGERYSAASDTYLTPPLSRAEYLANGGREVLSEDKLAPLADLIGNLEDVPDVSEVMACVKPTGQRDRAAMRARSSLGGDRLEPVPLPRLRLIPAWPGSNPDPHIPRACTTIDNELRYSGVDFVRSPMPSSSARNGGRIAAQQASASPIKSR